MAKAKSTYVVIKLISTAKTGVVRSLLVSRRAPRINQVKYDPVAQRHVLFQEEKKRKLQEQIEYDYQRRTK